MDKLYIAVPLEVDLLQVEGRNEKMMSSEIKKRAITNTDLGANGTEFWVASRGWVLSHGAKELHIIVHLSGQISLISSHKIP